MANLVAQYEDGAGTWTVTSAGRALVTCTPNGEYIARTLTRAPKYDNYLQPEFILTARYAACDDYAANGVAWIDGIAYTID